MSPHSRFAQNKTILKALSALITAAVGPPALGYDLATDLICTGCVQTTDIAKNAVGTAKLKNNSVGALKIKDGNVTTAKIKGGAVTYDKLAPALKSSVDGAAAYGYRNYVAGSGNVTQKTFELLGDFGDCGGVGAPDTELRNITSANLRWNNRVVHTAWRYAGGVAGTLCGRDIDTYIADAGAFKLIRHRAFASDGTTKLADVETGYDANTDPDHGWVLWASAMRDGAVFGSLGLTTDSVDSSQGLSVSSVNFSIGEVSETIDEGGPNLETFYDCVHAIEERKSTHLWTNTAFRMACAGVGTVIEGYIAPDGSHFRAWSLTGYTGSQ